MKMIRKILIANRGEIAVRLIRTCQQMGIRTVAIYSEVDQQMPFVRLADESVCLGPAPASESYLNVPKIVDVCHHLKVDAVHPGYGFLSENADFAEALQKADIIFIGPSVSAIRTMGSKSEAKALAEELKIPIISGYRGEDQSLERLSQEAQSIGFPVLIKAIHGGGGKGMRRVDCVEDFEAALAGCQREALGAFSKSAVMLEKYIVNPRHIEVQIFGDQHDNVIALSERDCSLQRRHQKVLEEAPADGLSESLRQNLHEQAIRLGKAVHYVGAGTVEFLVDSQQNYYFLEMNTRLQVEHPVTEMILGLDLVAWQIRVARGEKLPQLQSPPVQGHALEARIYAEDPTTEFLPSTGVLTQFHLPESSHQRFDAGYAPGNKVSIYYDPLLAKLIVHGSNRREAYQLLAKALGNLQIEGVKSNRDFLLQLCQSSAVVEHLPHIAFLDQNISTLVGHPTPSKELLILLGLALLDLQQKKARRSLSPWDEADGWRSCGFHELKVKFSLDKSNHELSKQGDAWSLDHQAVDLASFWGDEDALGCMLKGKSYKAKRVASPSKSVALLYEGYVYTAHIKTMDYDQEEGEVDHAPLNAPMPGRIISVLATAGQTVDAGSPLVILEAMKMEHTIRAPYQGIVEEIFFVNGDFVEEGMELARVKAA